jgi:hypothetical protein
MTKFTDNLWRDLAQEHGADLAQAGGPQAGRSRRPGARVIAGGTLAVAGIAAVATLGLTSTGSSTAGGTRIVTDAFTITQSSSSVQVQINQKQSIIAANERLNSLVKEQVTIQTASGPAPAAGAVSCTPGVPNMQGPSVQVLLGSDGTQVVAPGTTAHNTGVGTWHLASCTVYPTGSGTGNTGVG